jgi:hypothetical protein
MARRGLPIDSFPNTFTCALAQFFGDPPVQKLFTGEARNSVAQKRHPDSGIDELLPWAYWRGKRYG